MSVQERIDCAAALIQQGMSAWVEAGKIIAELVDSDPLVLEEMSRKKDIPLGVLERFEQIGRKQLHPQLLCYDAPGFRKMTKLPYLVQERYLSEPVSLLIKTETGWESLRVDVKNLTQDQADQVFTRYGVRDAAAQRAFIEDRAAKRVAPPANGDLPYRIVGNKIVIMSACTLSTKELANILAEATK
jgi:hypothetical protein